MLFWKNFSISSLNPDVFSQLNEQIPEAFSQSYEPHLILFSNYELKETTPSVFSHLNELMSDSNLLINEPIQEHKLLNCMS